jgi:C4-dicarboxylate transporter, DctM subunit
VFQQSMRCWWACSLYRTISVRKIPEIIIETLRLSSLSLFALATANALGELMGYYGVTTIVSEFFLNAPGGMYLFIQLS